MNTGQLFCLYDDAGKLTLKNINSMKLNLLIDEETGETFDYSSSIDEQTYNKIKLTYDNEQTGKRELYIAQDGEKMNQWGVLQYFEALQNATGAAAKANALLTVSYTHLFITLPSGDLLHGTSVNYEIVDNVLHFFVNYNLPMIRPAEETYMETLETEVGTIGGD